VLTGLRYTGHLYNRTLPLPICKCICLLAVGIGTGKHVAVLIKNLSLEMVMLAPSVLAEFGAQSVGFHVRMLSHCRNGGGLPGTGSYRVSRAVDYMTYIRIGSEGRKN